jgi:hypothetical protein
VLAMGEMSTAMGGSHGCLDKGHEVQPGAGGGMGAINPPFRFQ